MKLPVQLAYERSISPSDVTFLVTWPNGDNTPLRYQSRIALGMKEGSASAYKSNGEAKGAIGSEDLAYGNPHEIDYCKMPYGANALECQFSISFSSEPVSWSHLYAVKYS